MKTLEDMDLLDNFLNNAAATSRHSKEIYRIIIETLLEKPLGPISVTCQQIIDPETPGKRGIRLDVAIEETDIKGDVLNVFDYEPHRKGTYLLPEYNRFRQARIDSLYMKAGDNDFSHMPSCYIITILDYDPVGDNQIMYTVEKHYAECPHISYDDGSHLIYFNTKGTKGGSHSIRNMLFYIGASRSENATDDATKRLASLIDDVKNTKEVRDSYMTLGEYIDIEVQEGIDAGIKKAVDAAVKEAVDATMKEAEEEKKVLLAEKDSLIAEYSKRINELEARLDSKPPLADISN